MAELEKAIRVRLSESEYENLKKICEIKGDNVSRIIRVFVKQYIEENKHLIQPKPLYTVAQWVAINQQGLPELYVNVMDFKATIRYKGKDITKEIPNGSKLATDAVIVAGGSISISGIYPPTDVILEEVQKRFS
ncbi:hypothetical protein BVF91_11535 [Thermoanaerobacterium sp. PSU-2]|uniref:hypothetical protein n=1 Tax=Thermoanaerobacterium sp. PSU-2 TaxID=1930849 RepID=UPI000A167629|nr:hypothetical protein [Thermoanaerobacterium sp. PSU-2]ORX22465.1 hypothetical protein BVF91_11535 [Thermoanaerobacterium sp. PSU-2]